MNTVQGEGGEGWVYILLVHTTAITPHLGQICRCREEEKKCEGEGWVRRYTLHIRKFVGDKREVNKDEEEEGHTNVITPYLSNYACK